MNLSSLSVKRPVTTIMFVLIIILLGFVSLSKLPIDLYPKIEIPVAIVSTQYSNVAPEEIENLVTRPIEEAVGTIENIDTIQSITSEGSSIVVVQFKFGTDMNFAALKMREKVDMVKGFLPDDASDPMVMQIDPNAQAIMQIAVSGADIPIIQDYANSVMKPALERLQGVASVDIAGGYDSYVSIKVQPEKLSGYGLTLDTLSQSLALENINLPAGSIKNGTQELNLRTVGEFESLRDIKQIPINLPTGATIKLEDIADVSLTNKDISSISKVNGEAAVSISVQKQSGTNTVLVANEIREVIDDFKHQSKYDIKIIFDSSTYIKEAIAQVANSGLVGGILAIFVLLIFLRNIRSTIIIGLTIPISIISTFILIYFNDITLNMMTLGGLALGIGMLVDNSVVVLENIYRYAQDGYSKNEAAILGSKEVAMAVTASTLTTVAVFLPIAFVDGIASIMFKELALTITFSLASSLVMSLTLIPMLASKILKVDAMQGKHHVNKIKLFGIILDKTDAIYFALETKYKDLLSWSLKHRKSVIIFTITIFIASIFSVSLIGMEFMPTADEGAFSINLELEPGSKVEDTSKMIDEVAEKIIDIEAIDYIFSTTAGNNFMSSSPNTGSIQCMLKPLAERSVSTSDVILQVERLTANIPGLKTTITSQNSMMIGGNPISIQLKGNDLDVLKDISTEISDIVKSVNGTRNVSSSLDNPIPQIEIKLKRNYASKFGLSTAMVSSTVKSMINGKTATRYKLNGDEIDVIIEVASNYNKSIDNLKQLNITSPTGVSVPLDLIADISIESGPLQINRDNQSRIVTVSSDIYNRDLASVTADIQEKINNINLPKGYTIEFGGQNKEMIEAFADLALALMLAIILVYMIIAAQFESLLTPFIIMFTTPLAISGGIIGLYITNRTISILSIIGFIMLSGIVVNNAIVLIDYINTRRSRGEERTEAILQAGKIRLRPILMTTLTTVLALIPMAIGIGEGAELQAPMATVVIFGLLISTLLTLVFIPVLYTIFDNYHEKFIHRKKHLSN